MSILSLEKDKNATYSGAFLSFVTVRIPMRSTKYHQNDPIVGHFGPRILFVGFKMTGKRMVGICDREKIVDTCLIGIGEGKDS